MAGSVAGLAVTMTTLVVLALPAGAQIATGGSSVGTADSGGAAAATPACRQPRRRLRQLGHVVRRRPPPPTPVTRATPTRSPSPTPSPRPASPAVPATAAPPPPRPTATNTAPWARPWSSCLRSPTARSPATSASQQRGWPPRASAPARPRPPPPTVSPPADAALATAADLGQPPAFEPPPPPRSTSSCPPAASTRSLAAFSRTLVNEYSDAGATNLLVLVLGFLLAGKIAREYFRLHHYWDLLPQTR